MKTVGASWTIAMLLWVSSGAALWCGEEPPSGGTTANPTVRLFPVEVSGRWGYMDQAGNVMIVPQYECAWDFSEGLACVQIGQLRGYINPVGALAIKPKFPYAGRFSGGRAPVFSIVKPWGDFFQFYMMDGGWGYADTKGNRISSEQQTHDEQCHSKGDRLGNGLAPERDRNDPRFGLWGYADRSGQVVIEPQFEEAGAFGDGLAPVAVLAEGQKPPDKRNYQWIERRKLVWGFIDRTGKMVLVPKHDYAQPFSGGWAGVRTGKWELVKQSDQAGSTYLEKVWMVGKWGYVDQTGAEIVQGQYDYVWPLSEGRGRILLGGKHGYVDDKGQTVITPQFDGAWEYSKGLARVIVKENEWYIDLRGAYVWDDSKRKIHQRLLAFREEAAEGKRKQAEEKYRAFLKEQAADPYVCGAGLAYLAEICGAGAFEELCAVVEGADPARREIAARALTALAGEEVTHKLIARARTAPGAAHAAYQGILGVRREQAGLAAVRSEP